MSYRVPSLVNSSTPFGIIATKPLEIANIRVLSTFNGDGSIEFTHLHLCCVQQFPRNDQRP